MATLLTSVQTPGSTGPAPDTPASERVRVATLACIARFGLSKTTLEDVARESGVSRATIYRIHPGGRDVLVQSVLVAEVDRFFAEVASVLHRADDDLEELLVIGLGESMRFFSTHEALGAIVKLEPGLLLPHFAFDRLDLVLARAAVFAAPYLVPFMSRDDAATGAGHLVRIVLSYVMNPDERVDPFDDASIRRLVRTHVMPGLVPGAQPSIDLRSTRS